jgi:hypothetical protein
MTSEAQDALNRAFSAVREDLGRQGIAWHQAWFRMKCETDSGSVSLSYTKRPGKEDRCAADASFDAYRLLRPARDQIPDAAGRPWNQAQLTLYADGRQEAAFDYPGPMPDPGRSYTEQEILVNMAECVRHDLIFDQWTEAWVEAGPELVPFLSCRNGPNGRLEEYIQDCNALSDWLGRLWKLRLESGQGPWGRVIIHLFRDSDRIETEFRPPEPGWRAPEPPPLPLPVPPLGELFHRIVAAERAEQDDMCRRMEEISGEHTHWKQSRLTAYRDEDDNLIVNRLVELTDGQKIDEPVEDDVEDLFIQVYDRLDGGDNPTGLDIPGLKVKAGASPRFTLVLKNDPPT